jgi:hypothetical protein
MKVIPLSVRIMPERKVCWTMSLLIGQDGIRRDAIARERGVEVSEPVIEPDEMINYD